MTTNVTYGSKEQAERMGKIEADKLTRRGYPTTLVEVRPVTIEGRLYLDGTTSSDMTYVKMNSETRWEAVLSD